jgi:hypothetical protein
LNILVDSVARWFHSGASRITALGGLSQCLPVLVLITYQLGALIVERVENTTRLIRHLFKTHAL